MIEGEGERAVVKPLFSIAEILAGVMDAGKRGIQIKRFKGLGEMNAKELFETTMNPENRKLLRIDMTDVVEAEEMFTKLMGDEVEPRRQFIEDNALNVRNLDILDTAFDQARHATLYLIRRPQWRRGRPTFASRFLPEESGELEFVNVDLIARGLSPFDPDAAAAAAGRIALTRVGRLIQGAKNFCLGNHLERAHHESLGAEGQGGRIFYQAGVHLDSVVGRIHRTHPACASAKAGMASRRRMFAAGF